MLQRALSQLVRAHFVRRQHLHHGGTRRAQVHVARSRPRIISRPIARPSACPASCHVVAVGQCLAARHLSATARPFFPWRPR
eukprot:2981453-Pyramimonas_sp.AAC.1